MALGVGPSPGSHWDPGQELSSEGPPAVVTALLTWCLL